MPPREALRKRAVAIATELKERSVQRQNDLAELKMKFLALEAQLDAADESIARLARYELLDESNFTCPRCWILNDMHSVMNPISGKDHLDIFKCERCADEIIV